MEKLELEPAELAFLYYPCSWEDRAGNSYFRGDVRDVRDFCDGGDVRDGRAAHDGHDCRDGHKCMACTALRNLPVGHC
jgi:hypothetical protein